MCRLLIVKELYWTLMWNEPHFSKDKKKKKEPKKKELTD